MMTIQHRYSLLIRQRSILVFFLLSCVLPALAAPFITKQPVNQRICATMADAVVFSVEVDGDEKDYVFQWQKFENPEWKTIVLYNGGSSYTASDPGDYRCKVIKKEIEELSEVATFIIDNVPEITKIIAPSVCNGDELVAGVDKIDTRGSDLISYEWKLRDNNNVETSWGEKTTNDNLIPDLVFTPNETQNNHSLTITVTNGCGSATYPSLSTPLAIRVYSTPPLPEPVTEDYCQGATAQPLSVKGGNVPVWFNENGVIIPTPTPDTKTTGIQKWWVSQKRFYPEDGNLACESNRIEVQVEILPVPVPPQRVADINLCVNDPGMTLQVTTGTNIKWYNNTKGQLPAAPQINTSKVETQIYYVSQSNGSCESSIDNGKITVSIRDRANADSILLSYNPELCPNNNTRIVATSPVFGSIFKWYVYSNKTGYIDTIPGNGSIFDTPVLAHDTTFYVTIQYEGLCESNYAQAAVINVRDIIRPKIIAPPNLVVNTNDGVCYADNIDTGFPVVSDNCTPQNKLHVISDPAANRSTRYEVGDTTLIWWVTDEAGNSEYALQNISVRDRIKPWPLVPPKDIIKEIDENENSAIAFYDWKYEDNCTPASELVDSLFKGLPSGSVFPLGETQIIRYIIDKSGNVDTCKFKVIVRYPYREMQVNLRWNRNPICPGQEVVITPVVSGGTGATTYSWSPRPWTAQVMRDYPTVNTNYEVTVSDGVTTIKRNLPVAVLETRQVELSLTVEGHSISMDEIFEGDEVLVTATSGYDAYKLMLNNEVIQEAGINNYVSFQADLGTYVIRVFATDDNFCVTQDQMTIEVESNKLPNVFTPNFDGKNDIFLEFLETPHNPKDFELQIFSRTGQLLYKGNKGWDGLYKGKVMSQGTYLYVVRRRMNNGEYRTFKGNVTIKL